MVDLKKLRSVRTLCVHDNCPDGLASAMILHDVLPDAEILFLQYKTPDFELLPAESGILFCDLSPPQARYREFIEAGTIVLDHHKSVKDMVLEFGPNGVYADEKADPGVSGAVLAYREVWEPLAREEAEQCEVHRFLMGDGRCTCRPSRLVESFAELTGVQDTWQIKSSRWEEACAQAESLRFWPEEDWLTAGPAGWGELTRIGPTLRRKQADKVGRTLENSYRFLSDAKTRVVLFQGGSAVSSDAAEQIGDGADLVAGFGFVCDSGHDFGPGGLKAIFSTRTKTWFDCSALAKAHGGGGHTKAAGFSRILEPGDLNPFTMFKDILNKYEADFKAREMQAVAAKVLSA